MGTAVHIIGGGLAGSEAAWQIAEAGVPVVLHEMRPVRGTEAHLTDGLAELVCSNSFRSDDPLNNAVGVLHEEMRRCGSLILRAADAHKVPAGGALAVDRHGFSGAVEAALAAHPLVTIVREEIAGLPPAAWESVIVATGPLTSPALASAIRDLTGEDALAFFDAIAPIVHRDSIDMSVAWLQSRYDRDDTADYINCPLDKEQYLAFVAALLAGETGDFKEWEKSTPYFDGCLPIEVMAARGIDTLRYGPMKPVGLTDPRTGRRAYAVVQLRQDNALGTLYNIVGFQTKLKHGAQKPVFRMIPRPRRRRVRAPRRPPSQHLPEQSPLAGRRSPAKGDAAPALRRPDHRRRGLCGERRHRPPRRPLCGGGAAWRRHRAAARHHRPGRASRPHHGRGRCRDIPAHEREFRPLPAAAGGSDHPGQQG